MMGTNRNNKSRKIGLRGRNRNYLTNKNVDNDLKATKEPSIPNSEYNIFQARCTY